MRCDWMEEGSRITRGGSYRSASFVSPVIHVTAECLRVSYRHAYSSDNGYSNTFRVVRKVPGERRNDEDKDESKKG